MFRIDNVRDRQSLIPQFLMKYLYALLFSIYTQKIPLHEKITFTSKLDHAQ